MPKLLRAALQQVSGGLNLDMVLNLLDPELLFHLKKSALSDESSLQKLVDDIESALENKATKFDPFDRVLLTKGIEIL